MFGAISFLIDVAEIVSAVAVPYNDVHETCRSDGDNCDDATGCCPLVDVVEDDGEVTVLIEMPGSYEEDVKMKVLEDILILSDSRDREFHEILLPRGCHLDEATCVCFNNGVTIIKFPKALSPCCQRKIA